VNSFFESFLQGQQGQAALDASRSMICIFARLLSYYLRNVRGLLFRITLRLKSRITGEAYLDRWHIADWPERLGKRIRSQPEHSG
jgi:hypothetical protein